jgi:hypothetical protein
VVGVRDRRPAVRRAAQVVAEDEHPAEQPGEDAAAGVHRDQVAPVRRGVEPPQPDTGGLTTGVGAVELAAKPPSSCRRREAAEPRDAGRLPDGPVRVARAEQRPVGHHQVQLHGLQPTSLAPGQDAQRRVGGDRPDPAPQVRLLRCVAGGHRAGARGQCRVCAGHLRHGSEDREVAHPVGGRSHRHPPGGHGRLHPGHDGGRVELCGDPSSGPICRLDTEPAQQWSHPSVDVAPVGRRQARGRLHHAHGVRLRAHPRGQSRQRGRHLLDKCRADPDETVATRRRLSPRQSHLGTHRPCDVLWRHLLSRPAHGMHQTRLCRRRATLDPLQLSDQVDPFPIRQLPHVDRRQPLPKRRHRSRRTMLQHNRTRVCHPPSTLLHVHALIVRMSDDSPNRRLNPVDNRARELGLWTTGFGSVRVRGPSPSVNPRLSPPSAGSRPDRRTPAAPRAPTA